MSQEKYDPILVDFIRKAMPNKIAEELVGVQPMGSPFSKEEYPYQINTLDFASFKDVIPMRQWCRETLKENEWKNSVQFFAFKNEQAYNWFLLRWR